MATLLPSEERDTETPDWSLPASPSISDPTCTQTPLESLYIRTWPASLPASSLPLAPMATLLPSEERDTEYPDWSPAASPSISDPTCTQTPLESLYIRTWPALIPVPPLPYAPMATILPSAEKYTYPHELSVSDSSFLS